MNNRVVITGIGVISPIGTGREAYWEALKAGKSGIAPVTLFDASEFTTQMAGEVTDFEPEKYIDKKEAKRMDRFSQFAVGAAVMAAEDAGINKENMDPQRMGVILGNGIGGIGTLEREHEKLLEKGPGRVSPFLVPMMIVNLAAGNVAIALGAQGPNTTVVTACASGTNAMGDAYRLLQRGEADVIFTGGTEASITPMGFAGFCTMKAMSTRNDDPTKASRPFTADRDGFVMGEGAGVMVFETLEHAQKRGAKIYGEVAGFGMTCDAYHITSPAPGGEGAARSMRLAIESAGMKPEDIDYINAHGTSTPYNDRNETAAIKSTFGDHAYKLCVNSTKSMTGHLLGASGGIEAIACLMSLNEDFVHPTINYETPDPELDLDYVPNVGKSKVVRAALSNSLGFGGHNASIIFKKFA